MAAPPDPNRDFAEGVVRRLREAGQQALFAGGCVRDLLLGRTPKDFDIATDAWPERVREVFGHRRTLAVGASFGVVVVVPSKADRDRGVEPVEVATFRTEGPYLDGRRPERVAFSTPEEDAKRRDFTINGMFLDPVGDRVLDYVGGERDLADGVIRAIGDPRERMTEDKLRLLRAVRFAATLDFRLDESTAEAVRAMAPQLMVVSAERIAQELKRMLAHPRRRRAVELCAECGLLGVVVPELAEAVHADGAAWRRTLRALDVLDANSFEPPFAVLLDGVAEHGGPAAVEAVCRRLKLSNAETEHVVWLAAHRRDLDGIRERRPSFLKRLGAQAGAVDLVRTVRARSEASDGDLGDVEFFDRFLRDTPPEALDPPPLVSGNDLIGLGLKPGPEFKRLLETIRDAQLDGAIASRDEALALARRLHGDGAADTT